MADLYSLLMAPDEITAQERASALQNVLRQKQVAGMLGTASTIPGVQRLGGQLLDEANAGERGLQVAAQERKHSLQQALALEQQKRQQDREFGLHERRLSVDEASRAANLGLDRQRIGLERERMNQPHWVPTTNPASGGLFAFDPKTREIVSLDQGPARGAKADDASGHDAEGPKLNDQQSKALNAYRRLTAAMPLIEQGMPDIGRKDAWATGMSPGKMSKLVPQELASTEGQRYFDASRDVVAALLRKESGAAISEDEWRDLGQLYIPMPFDAPSVKADKLNRLKNTRQTLLMEMGPSGAKFADKGLDKGGDINLAAGPTGAVASKAGDVWMVRNGKRKMVPSDRVDEMLKLGAQLADQPVPPPQANTKP